MPKKTRLRRHGHVTHAERRSPTNALRAHRISPHTMQHEQRHATTAHDATTQASNAHARAHTLATLTFTHSHSHAHSTPHELKPRWWPTIQCEFPKATGFRLHKRRAFHGGVATAGSRERTGPRRHGDERRMLRTSFVILLRTGFVARILPRTGAPTPAGTKASYIEATDAALASAGCRSSTRRGGPLVPPDASPSSTSPSDEDASFGSMAGRANCNTASTQG